MKRRNADCGKRRPVKRNKITEGMYGSNTLLYMKFLILWATVITADFMLEFRFEFLWPFWLLLRSVHDSFKYKGLAFSVLFVCIAITSDLVCLFFIPVHWLFFAASTYVWVQYVWHTDKGICLPTIILWMLFVYLEAAIRWKDSRHMPHLDLCRPFAAHCIGYPVVTLGFGFKSYVGYRIRQRKQREVAKENEFYMQLLQQALPQEDSATSSAQPEDTLTSLASTDHIINHSMSDHLQKELPLTQLSPIHNNQQHHHHHSNHHKNAQNSSNNKSLNLSTTSATSLTSVPSTSASPATTTANGHTHHSSSNGVSQSAHKHNRRSLDKDRSSEGKSTELSSSRNHSAYQQSPYPKETSKTFVTSTEHSSTAISMLFASPSSSSSASSLSSVSSKGGVQLAEKDSSSTRNSDKDKQNGSYDYHHQNSVGNKVETKGGGQTNGGPSGNKNNNSNADGPLPGSSSSNSHNKHNSFTDVSAEPAAKSSLRSSQNGGVLNVDSDCNNQHQQPPTETTELIEKVKGRRNRVKQQKDTTNHTTVSNSPKDNHHNNSSSNNNNTSSNAFTNHQNHHSSTEDRCITPATTYSPVCATCIRLEAEVKKFKLETGQYKQIENELRQKSEACATAKSNLQAKSKENEELDKKIQEMLTNRQSDRQSIQASERRLAEERRKIESLAAQLANERKNRKQLEEKAARTECFETCKTRKVQLEADCKQLRRELAAADDSKKSIEQQNRNYEQELRKYEAEFRNREARESTEVLMSALAALQDKNSTLEKNLSAETRVKLDLFSALGDAKRQLEVDKNLMYGKDKEISDLRAKIAQLLAVMPSNESFGMSPSSGGTSMLRLADGSQLHQVGPASPMSSHKSLGGSPLISQLQSLGVFTSVSSAQSPSVSNQQHQQQAAAVAAQQQAVAAHHHHHHQQQQLQLQQQQQQQHLAQQQASNLDPNATVYTPKNLVGGAEA